MGWSSWPAIKKFSADVPILFLRSGGSQEGFHLPRLEIDFNVWKRVGLPLVTRELAKGDIQERHIAQVINPTDEAAMGQKLSTTSGPDVACPKGEGYTQARAFPTS